MIVLYVLAALVVLLCLATVVVYVLAFYSPLTKEQFDPRQLPVGEDYEKHRDKILVMIDQLTRYNSETVAIVSYDGLTLVGKYIHVADGAPVDIMVHGYRGLAIRDFSGGAVARIQSGHNVLLVEQRAHERSGGHTISFGIKERFDVVSWANYAVQRFGNDVKLTLYGVSMGAATVLMSSCLNLPPQVKAICVDCPYSAPSDILKTTIKTIHLPVWLCYPLLVVAARVFGGFNLSETSAEQSVKNTKVPVLLMHGKADNVVPYQMSQKIAAANPDMVELHLWEDAAHAMSFVLYPDEYLHIERDFLAKHLN